ncbi:MAG: HEAT repeat domain-containing protein [Elusimicrobiota bacterium]
MTKKFSEKIKELNIIKNELLSEKNEKKLAVKLLTDFIKDDDIRIRLKAIMILNKIDPQKASNELKKLIQYGKNVKSIADQKILEEINSPYTLDILLEMADFPDMSVKKVAISSLSKIMKKENISEEMKEKIIRKIKKLQKEEDWVVF